MIATEAVVACLRDGDALPTEGLTGGDPGFASTRWRLALPDQSRLRRRFIRAQRAGADAGAALPGSVLPRLPANELLRDLLLRLGHSKFRAALHQSWEWRGPGGAVHRARSVQPARNLSGGGVALPLVRKHAGLDIAFVVPIFSLGGVEKVVLRMSGVLAAQAMPATCS